MADDYYKTLGVSRGASQAEIQKAYRDLARKFHPDMNPNDKDAKRKFQQVQAAFDVLNDPAKRENYDRYGSSFEGGIPPRGGATWSNTPGGGGEFHFDDDLAAQLFGGRFGGGSGSPEGLGDIFRRFQEAAASKGRRGGAPRRGGDVEADTEIPFQVSITGGEVQLNIPRASGKVDTLTVKIPAGIEDGKKIRLRGQGEPAGRRGTPGDLLITVHVAPHPMFQRQGKDLHVRLPVTLGEAVLGAKVDVPTPSGTVNLRVPPGTSSGAKLRIKGRGVPAKNGSSGDLLAEVQIVLPKDLSDADRQTIQEFDRRHAMEPRAKLRW